MDFDIGQVAEEARSLAASLYNRWPEQDRDDLVQEVLIRYVRTFADGTSPDNPSAWLTTVIRNTAANLHAHRERRPEDPHRDDDPMGALGAAMSNSFASLLPVRDALLTSVLELVEDERTQSVLRMKYLDNLSSREIAEELGIGPNTVDQVASRGKRRLRDALMDRPDLVDELQRLHPRNF